MRRLRSALLFIPLAVGMLVGCGSTTSSGTAGCTPQSGIDTSKLNLVLSGKLVIATDATYPPQEYTDPTTGKYTGMEVDLANEFAKRLCLTPVVQNVQFSTIIGGITASSPGQQYYDMSISAFTINDDRKKQVDMIPYFTAGESLIVPKGKGSAYTKLADLCGKTVSVEAGTVEHDEIAGTGDPTNPGLNEPGGACVTNKIKLLTFDTQDKAIQPVLNGTADAGYQDSPVTDHYAKQYPDKLEKGPITVQPSPEGIVVRKDNPAFESAITTVLNAMRSDGAYLKILNTWGLSNGAYPPLS